MCEFNRAAYDFAVDLEANRLRRLYQNTISCRPGIEMYEIRSKLDGLTYNSIEWKVWNGELNRLKWLDDYYYAQAHKYTELLKNRRLDMWPFSLLAQSLSRCNCNCGTS